MDELDPLIHAPKRLRIMTVLSTAEVEFSRLQERLGLSAPDLSKQMRQLVDAGYVEARKTGKGPGSTTWYKLTRQGRRAYDDYLATLRRLLDGASAS
ncbi:MAG: transcriptional regulator [Actinomycetes bacterium]|jgi:DNA-binding transcriptional ArsR family regulator|nr:ArsR family transcriptional regulator [Acidimicrobiia bacterium]